MSSCWQLRRKTETKDSHVSTYVLSEVNQLATMALSGSELIFKDLLCVKKRPNLIRTE